ncbi:DNA helicase [Tanacetum coccineum]
MPNDYEMDCHATVISEKPTLDIGNGIVNAITNNLHERCCPYVGNSNSQLRLNTDCTPEKLSSVDKDILSKQRTFDSNQIQGLGIVSSESANRMAIATTNGVHISTPLCDGANVHNKCPTQSPLTSSTIRPNVYSKEKCKSWYRQPANHRHMQQSKPAGEPQYNKQEEIAAMSNYKAQLLHKMCTSNVNSNCRQQKADNAKIISKASSTSRQIYHWIGSMCPDNDATPRFLQLYIYDTENEVKNRMAHFGGECEGGLKKEIVEGLIEFLDNNNALVQLFRTARDKYMESDIPNLKVKLYNVIGTRRYELPTPETIGAIVFGSSSSTMENEFDLIIEEHSRFPQRVNKLHPCYMSLQFPLLFIYGEQGYHKGLKLLNTPNATTKANKQMSMNMYYSYQIHERLNQYTLLPRGGRLFQQYVVTAYCAIEQDRLDYIRQNQSDIRNEYLSGLYDAIMRGDRDGSDLGTRLVLTASFIGGPRYMYSHYLDALAICRVHGNPSFFITFTCNAKWPEIEEYMEAFPELTAADRADIVDRVFEKKIRDYIKFVRNSQTMGDITAVLYTIEFQKRGLPHCHSLLWVTEASKINKDSDVDIYISAELPDPTQDAEGYRVISELMIHGPCGYANTNAPCLKDGTSCDRNFPKPYSEKTSIDKDGYVHYRRRATRIDTERQNVRLDNRYVVPYNKTLCMRYYARINVEYRGWTMLIKYLFKYISKGTDRVIVNVTKPVGDIASTSNKPTIQIDEIKNFVEARYIGPHEACWRILDFPIHYRDPAVQILAIHLENMQQITFRKYAWYPTNKYWQRRHNLSKHSIGRSFLEIRTINSILHPTNKAACEALGLLGGDQEWIEALQEAAISATASELRKLFIQILMFCDVGNPLSLWDMFWKLMSDDIPRRLSKTLQLPHIEKSEKKNESKAEANIRQVIAAISKNIQKLIFVYGHGFLWKAITYALRSDERIVLVVASSGIASLLLLSGRTAHSRFKIPLNLNDGSICNIKKNSQLADLLKQSDSIIWDEAPMSDRRCFEALDNCLKDILDNPNTLFGGKSIILGGETLPVKKKASKLEIVDASITSSYLWPSFKTYTLHQNMRLTQSQIREDEKTKIQTFSQWLLKIGDGDIGTRTEDDSQDTATIQMPNE